MLYLSLCILLTTVLFVLFREFQKYALSLFQVIMLNYWICVLCGWIHSPTIFEIIYNSAGIWLVLSAIQGILFMSMFYLTARSVQQLGLGYTTMITKMSVVIPIFISVIAFNEHLSFMRWIGIAAALLAILLIHYKYLTKRDFNTASTWLWGSLILFIGSGITDANFKIFHEYFGAQVTDEMFTISIFFFAGLTGLIIMIPAYLQKKIKYDTQNIIGGILLGIPNYFTVLFLLYALQTLPGSQMYPINNIGLLILASLMGILRYHEKYDWTGWVGLALAIVAIGCML